tara:strand:- start:2771 stop:2974 length:204 start_codon:yes stop_codon:yes gene_type:complete
MSRPTHAQLRAQGAAAERARVLGFFDAQQRNVTALIGAGRIDAESGSLLQTRLQTIAGQIAEDLHGE